jgi:ribosomal protein S20
MARSAMKTNVQKVFDSKKSDDIDQKLNAAISAIDKNVKRGVVHKNTAAHTKQRLYRHCNAKKS